MKFSNYLIEQEILKEFSVDNLKKTIKRANPAQLKKIQQMISGLVSGNMISKDDAANLRSMISNRM